MNPWTHEPVPFGRTPASPDVPVIVYGTSWCGHTMLVRRYLERAGVPYRYIDTEAHPEVRAQLRWWAGGSVRHPTVYIGGEVLVAPDLDELDWALSRSGLQPWAS
jgi:mycoredoxin